MNALSYERREPSTESWSLDLRALFRAIGERAWLVILCTVLALAGAAAYIIRTPKTYVASASLEVERQAPNVMDIKSIQTEELDTVEAVKTIEAKLGSDAVMRKIVRDPELEVTPEKLGLSPGQGVTPEKLAGRVRKLLTIGIMRGTRLIGITASHSDPDFAAGLANAVVRAYIQQLDEERAAVVRQANSFLHAEALRLKEKLEQSERALQHYKEKTQAISLEGTQNIVVAQLQELNSKMAEAKTERLKFEAAIAQIATLGKGTADQLLAIPSVAASPEVIEQQKRLAQIQGELANLNERYLEKHPKLIQAKSQLEQVRSDLERATRKAAESVNVLYQTALKTEENFGRALADQEKKALGLSSAAISYRVLEREVESDRAMFESVLKRLQESDVTRGLTQGIVRTVDTAVAPLQPAAPRVKLILAGALVLGLLAGLALALILNALDPTLKTVDETERTLGAHVLAAVPRGRKHRSDQALVDAGEGLLAEAFRTLRTSLALREGTRTLLFTSATENDGKTFCAINCAAAFARAGSRTLLIDADLRKPSIGEALFPGGPRPGLTDVLLGRVQLDRAICESAVPNLAVLTAGRAIGNPAELLHGKAFGEFIRSAAAQFDYVIVDSAPLQSVSDTLLLVKAVDGVCFVLRAGETHRRAAMKSYEALLDVGATPVGVVLNRVHASHGGYYYHYQTGSYGGDVYGDSARSDAPLLTNGTSGDSDRKGGRNTSSRKGS